MRQVTRDDFAEFILAPIAVLHFDTEWNKRGRPLMRQIMADAAQGFGDQVAFGEVDCDQNVALTEQVGVENVPAVAYFRAGTLVATLIGVSQNVQGRIERLLRGESIGYNDGLSGTGAPGAQPPPAR